MKYFNIKNTIFYASLDPSAQPVTSRINFWLFEYDAPFERETHPLYNDTKISTFYLNLNWNYQ